MRNFGRWLIVVAMVVPITFGVAQHVGAATHEPLRGTDCKTTSGSTTLTPGYPKIVTPYPDVEAKEKNQKIVTSGSFSNCGSPGEGGPTSGTFTSTVATHDPSDCNELLNNGDTADPTPDAPLPNGTIHIVWNTGQTSDSNIQLHAVPGSSTKLKITSQGTAGLFAGLNGTQTITFSPVGSSNCFTADLTDVTIAQAPGAAGILEIG